MSVDKEYCMSSYLAFRYIDDDSLDFADGLHHLVAPDEGRARVEVSSVEELDEALSAVFESLQGKRLGLLLSGGMDSACLASYMPGAAAYTFRFLDGAFRSDETQRAEAFAERYGMDLHYVDISWESMRAHIDPVIINRGAPVHSIEPQLYQAALQAKADGVEHILCVEGADIHFGGLTRLLSRDWSVQEFIGAYTYLDPAKSLLEPVDMSYVYKRHGLPDGRMDVVGFLNDVYSRESTQSFVNAFDAAGIGYTGAYNDIFMRGGIDIDRIRAGESKHLIRGLFARKYEGLQVPEKTPMPRPVDVYFSDWAGPTRPEFRDDMDVSSLSGNQRWQVWCLERFLDMVDGGVFA